MENDNEQPTDDEKEIEILMKLLSYKINELMPRGWGFSLFLMEYGSTEDGKTIYYGSSIEKLDVLNFLREWIRKQTN